MSLENKVTGRWWICEVWSRGLFRMRLLNLSNLSVEGGENGFF